MKKKKLLALFGMGCLVLMLVAMPLMTAYSQPATKTFKWRVQTFAAPVMRLYSVSLKNLAQMVKESTGGQVIIETYPSNQLIPQSEVFGAMRDGVLDGVLYAGQYYFGIWPGFAVDNGMPMAFYDVKDQSAFAWGDYNWDTPFENFVRPYYAKYGIYYLTSITTDLMVLLTKKPLYTVGDWRGYKIRGSGLYQKFFANMGATPVMITVPELYTGLATGTIDGTSTGIGGHRDLKTYEVCKYAMWPPLNGCLCHVAISMKTWNQLPPHLQTIVSLTAHKWTNWHSRCEWYNQNIAATEALKKLGVKFVDFKDMDVAYAEAGKVWDEVSSSNPDSAKAVELFKKFMKLKGFIK